MPATLQLVGDVDDRSRVVVALVVGVLAAVRRGFDRVATLGAVAGISLPVFWFGLVLQLVFANALGWLPSSGRSSFARRWRRRPRSRISCCRRPCSRVAHAAGWSRYLRGSMRQALAHAVHDAARARGVSERRIVLRHALRNALLPFATVVLLDASIMASGAVVTESVFAWPGVGSLFTEALAKRDYTVLMAFLMCASIAVVVLNLVADVAVHALDPRTREAA